MEIIRGGIYICKFNMTVGAEQQGLRPVLVIQNDKGNINSPTTVVIPFTNYINDKNWMPTHMTYYADDILFNKSILLVEQMRVIDKSRIYKYLGKVKDQFMQKVNEVIKIELDLNERNL